MASPQKENGYTPIANEILEALIQREMSSQELRAVLFVIRKTYGFNKKSDFISLSQIAKALWPRIPDTVPKKNLIRCSQIMKQLELMKILRVNENISGIGKSYCFQKDYRKWVRVNKNIKGKGFVSKTVNNLFDRPLIKTLSTKDNNTKDNIQKTMAKKNFAHDFIKKYCEIYKTKFGINPVINGKAQGIAKRLTKDLGLTQALHLVEIYLRMDTQWFKTKGYDLMTFEANLNTVQLYAKPRKVTRPEIPDRRLSPEQEAIEKRKAQKPLTNEERATLKANLKKLGISNIGKDMK